MVEYFQEVLQSAMGAFKARLARLFLNLFPPYAGTGASIEYISSDWREVRIKLPLSWRTRNIVGTIFGGSMYAAVDPVYMAMLIRLLGSGYVVWDKAACIRFKKPGRGTLYAKFLIDDAELNAIKEDLVKTPALDRQYTVDLVDGNGTVHATVEKTIHIRRKEEPGEAAA